MERTCAGESCWPAQAMSRRRSATWRGVVLATRNPIPPRSLIASVVKTCASFDERSRAWASFETSGMPGGSRRPFSNSLSRDAVIADFSASWRKLNACLRRAKNKNSPKLLASHAASLLSLSRVQHRARLQCSAGIVFAPDDLHIKMNELVRSSVLCISPFYAFRINIAIYVISSEYCCA